MHLMVSSDTDWHVEIRAITPPLRFTVIGWQATVYRPDGTVQESRSFRNPDMANRWAMSWGLPLHLTEQV